MELKYAMVASTKSKNSELVAEAFNTACDWFDFTKEESARMLGVPQTTLVRKMSEGFDPNSKQFETQVLFLKIYRNLYTPLGGDRDSMKEWMIDYNHNFNDFPKALCFSSQGILNLSEYLDAISSRA